MIDPIRITKFDRTLPELEEFLLFCVAVAGKKAVKIAQALEDLLAYGRQFYGDGSPFEVIRSMAASENLAERMCGFGIGCFNMKSKYLVATSNCGFDLKTCTAEDLETISGIGAKTSRYFILHSRKDVEMVPLDTHMLKFLRDLGYAAPKSTPSSKKYRYLESEIVRMAKESGLTLAELDLTVWNWYAGYLPDTDPMKILKKHQKMSA